MRLHLRRSQGSVEGRAWKRVEGGRWTKEAGEEGKGQKKTNGFQEVCLLPLPPPPFHKFLYSPSAPGEPAFRSPHSNVQVSCLECSNPIELALTYLPCGWSNLLLYLFYR